MSEGKQRLGCEVSSEVVMSDASRRKRAVCLRAASGVVGFWVVRKVRSHCGDGCRDLVCEMWAESWGRRMVGVDMGW